ncbi:aspartyl protease family protein [Stenotrophomonas sp. 24(2023)]|uniref:aspartyl protease family protein n=1 Tax=Stenotrophomonas sp. 24(2023) TaxID=3068324 RepID=UPI0027E0CE3C|nr:aspartyl protease family protein [Stenotrophomonas sp. 24(2023)]WMJ70877.1 aspartyl protease family protein [Stenotrophomonas sp. 24(2023)]
MRYFIALAAALLWVHAVSAQAPDATAVLDRARSASGGPQWDTVKTLQLQGERSAGGLSGAWQLQQDVRGGRYAEASHQGGFDYASGYDGQQVWRLDPGGEVGLLDGPVPRRAAASQAWLAARGYWSAQRPAHFGPLRRQYLGRHAYHVLPATPAGGDPLELWFEVRSGLLRRVVLPTAGGASIRTFSDHRRVQGLLLPHRITVDSTDAAGHSDPRLRSEVRVQHHAVNGALADSAFAPPAMPNDAYIATPTGTTQVPFDLVNNHAYIDAEVDGQPARFLVDTGAANLLTPAAARRLGLAASGQLSIGGAGDSTVALSMARARHLRIGDAHLPSPVFYVVDLGQQLDSMGTQYDGYIGYETFRRFAATLDYGARRLQLSEPGRYVPPAHATALAFEQDAYAPVINATLDGVPLRLWVDSGSRNALSLFSPFVHAHQLLEKYGAGEEAVVGWGIGGPTRSHPVRLGRLHLAGQDIDGLVGDLSTATRGALALPDYGALLGGALLRRFTVGLDYQAKRMYFAPNAENAAPQPFDRSGLWLQAGKDVLQVGDVAKGSAAAAAGLVTDDQLTRIDGMPVSTRSLGQWRTLLAERPPGTPVTLTYLRNGVPGTTTLVLAERIPVHWPPLQGQDRGSPAARPNF